MPVQPPSPTVQSLIDYLDAAAQVYIGAPYVALSVYWKQGAFRVLAEGLVNYFGGVAVIGLEVVDLVGADFTAEIGGTSRLTAPLATAATTVTRYRRGFTLLRGGVDNMVFVEGTPTTEYEWSIDEDNKVVLFGDVTAAPDTYRCRYVSAV